MTIVNGWLDWCEHLPGPTDKVYSAKNAGNGLALHSMEGYGYGGIHGRMNNTDRDPDGRYTFYAQASWMFSLMVDGTLIQHYPVTASTWTSGNWLANTTLWGVEAEGKAGAPLTAAQVKTVLRLWREYEAYTGKFATREHPIRTLWEHNEVAMWAEPNGGPTSCPSHRYDPAYAANAASPIEEDDMTPEEREEHRALLAIFGGRDKVLKARDGGMDFLLGYAIEQADQNQLEAAVARLEAAGGNSVLRALRDELNALVS